MFTQGDLKERGFENKKYLTFKTNTITYAVPSDSELANKMRSAKVGIVFHTAYEGESLDNMSASFKVDLSNLNQTADVWFDDAYIKDFSGIATMTAKES